MWERKEGGEGGERKGEGKGEGEGEKERGRGERGRMRGGVIGSVVGWKSWKDEASVATPSGGQRKECSLSLHGLQDVRLTSAAVHWCDRGYYTHILRIACT